MFCLLGSQAQPPLPRGPEPGWTHLCGFACDFRQAHRFWSSVFSHHHSRQLLAKFSVLEAQPNSSYLVRPAVALCTEWLFVRSGPQPRAWLLNPHLPVSWLNQACGPVRCQTLQKFWELVNDRSMGWLIK